jgi:MotA/TolQ/ExbB proton channel family
MTYKLPSNGGATPAPQTGVATTGRSTSGHSTSGRTTLAIEPVWFEWLALAGMLLFGAWLLGVQGVWLLLLRSDPTGITLIIIVIFAGCTLWGGTRAKELGRQRRWLETLRTQAAFPALAPLSPNAPPENAAWAQDYWAALVHNPGQSAAALDLLMEKTHGPHSTAWWVNGIQLKLGLLGKVIGFSVLALNIGQLQNFDPAQSQELLKSLTTGLGVALLTTMVGLVGNILFGLQLTRLDRFADELVARAQQQGLYLTQTPLQA